MSDYGPPPPTSPPPYGGPPSPPPPAAPTLADRLGARLLRRPEPRFGVTLAAVGVGLVIFGVLVWAGEYASSGGGGGGGPFGEGGGGGSDSRKILGIALSLVVVAIGYAVAILRQHGPLTNAGVAASALGIPVLMGFLSYDPANTSGLPISTDAIAIVSMVVWLASYLVVPAVRGHVFYLGATLLTLWLYLLDKIEPHLFSFQWIFPFAFVDNSFDSSGNFDVPSFSPPDFNTVAGVCLVFGLGYYLIALALDSRGRAGMAVAFVLAGFLATASGIAAAAVNLAQVATGILLIVLGAAIGAYGARSRRRFTTWLSCGAIGLGIIVILAKAVPDNATEAGISMIVIGTLLVGVAAAVSQSVNEPDETVVNPAAQAVQPQP